MTGSRNMAVSRMRSEKICNLALTCGRIAKIPSSYTKSGSGNTLVASDFLLEVEIWPFCACAMKKICNMAQLWPNRLWTRLWGRYHVSQNVFLIIIIIIIINVIIICPTAIAYSMGQIIKSVCVGQFVCVCLSVCLSVCRHSHGRISLSICTKFDTGVNLQK